MGQLIADNPMLSQSSELTHEVLDLLPLGVCVFDRDLQIRFWNRTLEEWTGSESACILGKHLHEQYPRLATPKFRSRFEQVFETLNPVILSPALHKYFIPVEVEGTAEQMMVQRTTLRPFSQDGTLVLALIEDVTITHQQLDQLRAEKRALVEAHRVVQDYAKQLSSSNEHLEQFAYVASHDLQEPLRKIAAYCQVLYEEQGGRLDDEGREYLEIAIRGAERLQRLIKDLLVYSRVTTHGKSLVATDADDCFQLAKEDMELAIRESGAVIVCEPLPTVLAEAGQLVQLFQNLLGNAIKYRADNTPQIQVAASESPEGYEFAIHDNGIGIPAEHQQRIFQIFQRLHTRQEYEGTGIGLAVCRRIVERFGGTMRVESEVGKGSTFYFSLRTEAAEP